MKTVVEDFTTTVGWSSDGTLSAEFINTHADKIAERLSGSLVVKVPSLNSGKSLTKTVAVDITGKTELVFSIWSRNLRGASFETAADYFYELTINGAYSWYIPTYESFDQVTIALPAGLSSITEIKITALTGTADFLILSDMCAIEDEFPLDVLQGVEDGLAWALPFIIPAKGILIGTVSGAAGDLTINFDWSHYYVERYSVITIDDGTHSETHQVNVDDEAAKGFFSTYDGKALVHSYTNASVYLQIPIEMDKFQQEQASPAITMAAFAPEPFTLTTEIDKVEDSFVVGAGMSERRSPMQVRYPVQISCMSRSLECQAIANRIVRWMLGQGSLWINARKHDFVWEQAPEATDPDSIDAVSQISYTLQVRVREEREDRVQGVMASATGVTVVAAAQTSSPGDSGG